LQPLSRGLGAAVCPLYFGLGHSRSYQQADIHLHRNI